MSVVTTCIPAYQAAGFIDRTLRCAQGQTHEAQRILVSIDVSEDDTEEICRAFARDDDRIEIVVHTARQGWVGNVNALLDRVESELSFIYFHDDVIEPTYCERLVAALHRRPDAASAHCDVILDESGHEGLRKGRPYEGSPSDRLLTFFVSRDRGALLRSMVRRSSPAGELRMTLQGSRYEMGLVAAGPALHVADPLYRRFVERVGGMTTGWSQRPFEDLLRGLRNNGASAQEVIEELRPTADQRELLQFGLAIYIARHLLSLERSQGHPAMTPLADVLPAPTSLRVPDAASALPAELAELCTDAAARVERRMAARR